MGEGGGMNHARLVIWNPDAYEPAKVREAAVYILGSLGARPEDVHQAALLLASGKY